jgi:predicted phage terminase large subunit-like protein
MAFELPPGIDVGALRIQVDREYFMGRGTLADFIEHAWPYVVPGKRFVRGKHVEVICEHLEAVSYGEIKNLIVNIPPGMMKSLSTCVFWPVWDWLQHPGTKFFFTSYTPKLVRDSNKAAKDLILSPWFQARWGDHIVVKPGSQVDDYKNSKGGQRFVSSVGGIATGMHPDIQVIDDPQKASDAESEANREKVKVWWGGTMSTRGATSPDLRRVVIMQRIHEDDLVGHVLATEKGEWEHLKLPMEYDPRRAVATVLGADWRQEPGELLCPALLDRKAVEKMKRGMGARAVSAQFDQDPAPADGSIFKKETFRFCKAEALPKSWDMVVQSWDCTFKSTKDSDFVSGGVWGISGTSFYLLDEFHARADFGETCDAIRAMKVRWPASSAILVEDKANGSAVISVLTKEIVGIIPVNPEGGKDSRANAVSPMIEAGNVVFLDPTEAPWVEDLLVELLSFPMGKNDDRVDMLSQALTYLQTKVSNMAAAIEGFEALANANWGG